MRAFLAALALLLTTGSARAQDFVSGMFITSPSWRCGEWLSTFIGAKEVNFQYLFKTAGPITECLEHTIKDPRTKRINVTLTNYPGLKNRRLEPYEAMAGYTARRFCRSLESWAPEIIIKLQLNARDALLQILPWLRSDQELWVTPDLESGCSALAQSQYIKAVRRIMATAPVKRVVFVSYGRLVPGADLYESPHALAPRCPNRLCIKANDGSPIDLVRFFSGNFGRIAWLPGSNCNPPRGPFVRPFFRNHCFSYADGARLRPFLTNNLSLNCWVSGVCSQPQSS